MNVDAILWDYDGTLVNSVPKNINITKQILAQVAPRLAGENVPSYLTTEDAYRFANHRSKNWQDLYVNYYGLSENEMIAAGTLWTKYQLADKTPVKLFAGIKQTMNKIHLRQGICSQNSAQNIGGVLKANRLTHKFQAIVGYDDIPNNVQKPNPFGGLKCLEKIFGNNSCKTIFYIGDHEGDVEFARNIEKALHGQTKVISVIVKYSGADTALWAYQPDYEIEKPEKLLELITI